MKLKIGDTYVDPWGGRQQMVVFEMRLMYQALGYEAMKNSKTGELTRLGEGNTKTPAQLLGIMAENKMAPTMAFIYKDFLNPHYNSEGDRVDAFGNEISLRKDMEENLYPIYWGALSELHEQNPETVFYTLAFFGFFGMSANVYGQEKSKANTSGPVKPIKPIAPIKPAKPVKPL